MKQAVLVNAANAAANIDGGVFDMGDKKGCSIECAFSGSTLAGTLKLLCSNTQNVWPYVAGSEQAVTASESHMWNITASEYRYIKPVWTATSGTGTLTVTALMKGADLK